MEKEAIDKIMDLFNKGIKVKDISKEVAYSESAVRTAIMSRTKSNGIIEAKDKRDSKAVDLIACEDDFFIKSIYEKIKPFLRIFKSYNTDTKQYEYILIARDSFAVRIRQEEAEWIMKKTGMKYEV